MERGRDEIEGQPKSSYFHWVYNTFSIPWILLKGFMDIFYTIVPPFPMYVGSPMVLLTTYNHQSASSTLYCL